MSSNKKWSVFLSLAVASSAAHAQPPAENLTLSLDPPPVSIVKSISEEPAPQTTPGRVDSGTPSSGTTKPAQRLQPARIERSVLETPRIAALPVSALTSPSTSKTKALLAAHAIESTELVEQDSGVVTEAQVANAAELIRQRFPNGKPQIERWVTEDNQGNIVNHGKYTEYDGQGTVIESGNFVYGERDGQWSKQIAEEHVRQLAGSIDKSFAAPYQSRAVFTNGQLNGVWTIVDGKDRAVVSWTYSAGVREGVSSLFNSAGEVTQSITYKHNLADGPAHYADNGSPAEDTEFTNGLMLRQIDKWHAVTGGKPRVLQSQEWHLVPMPLNVASSDWSENKVQFQSTEGVTPIRHGMSTTFYASGQREFEGNYDHGQRTGTFAWWYPNGQQKTVGEYRADKEHSGWTWWHENGMKQATGMFADGSKIDEWSQWSPEGTLVKRSTPEAGSQVAERILADEPVVR